MSILPLFRSHHYFTYMYMWHVDKSLSKADFRNTVENEIIVKIINKRLSLNKSIKGDTGHRSALHTTDTQSDRLTQG